MHSEPDFELLSPAAVGAGWRLALIGLGLCAAASLAGAATLWHLQRQAQLEWRQVQQSSQRYVAPAPVADPAYAPLAREAATMMRRPVDGWLRELERCLPTQARVREFRVDVRAARVTVQAELQGELALSPWLQCLNAGLESPVWRASQVGAAADATAVTMALAWRPAWTLVLERTESP